MIVISTRTGTDRGVVSTSKWSESVWLVAPLVAKLPAAVQGRVLKQAGQVMTRHLSKIHSMLFEGITIEFQNRCTVVDSPN